MAYIDTKHFGKCETCKHYIDGRWCDVPCQEKEFYSPDISEIPTADVVEVKHGEWIKVQERFPRYVCTSCRHLYNNMGYKYCPNCGAKMDGRSDTDDR